jgi:Ca2+-binding EF-hand superfamily protein
MLSRFSPFSGNLVKEALTNPENETAVRNLFNSLDANKSSGLDEDELKKFTEGLLKINSKLAALALDVETLNRRIFRLVDRNSTGHLTYSDFHSFLLNRCWIDASYLILLFLSFFSSFFFMILFSPVASLCWRA